MNDQTPTPILATESAVQSRYRAAAQRVEPALCCAVEYSPDVLTVIPREVIERDYGCGDPTSFVRLGDTVLDLGSGGGKLCFIAAQVVGPEGRVIGVDCNPEMLALARKHAPTVAERLGFQNVEFRNGLIQDLRLDLDRLGTELSRHPITDPAGYLWLRNLEERLRQDQPLVAEESVDCVISNCVLNLVRKEDREQLFREIFRVLRRADGWRLAILSATKWCRPILSKTRRSGRVAFRARFARRNFSRSSRPPVFMGSRLSNGRKNRGRPSRASSFAR